MLCNDTEFSTIPFIRRSRNVWKGIWIKVAGIGIITGLRLHIITNAIVVYVSSAVSAANPDGVQFISITIAVPVGDVCASAIINSTRAIADATRIVRPDAIVLVVTDAIRIDIGCTGSTANANGIQLVPVAVTVAVRNVLTTTLT